MVRNLMDFFFIEKEVGILFSGFCSRNVGAIGLDHLYATRYVHRKLREGL